MDGPPNLKHLRPGERQDEDLYFEDGSIILSAKDSEGNLVYFRVHKSLLARHSTVFKDMFSVPSPVDIDLYDDLPLVHIHDSSEDLKQFLQFMYDPSFLPLAMGPDTPALVTGPLKLATKYQADSLRNRIVSHIKLGWPTTLHDWDDITYGAVQPKPDSLEAGGSGSQPSPNESRTIDFRLDPIPFLPLARECDLPDILATILYSLCYDSEIRRERLSRMTRGDLELLLLGKERMMSFICGPASEVQLQLQSWVDWSWTELRLNSNCTRKECYNHVLLKWIDIVDDVLRGDPMATFRTHVLEFRRSVEDLSGDIGYYRQEDWERDNMCIQCMNRMADGLENLRQSVFAELPTLFTLRGSGSWE